MNAYSNRSERVYYFGTCLADTVYPGAGLAGIRLLQREGVKVTYPQEQSCCGQPAYNSGFINEARSVARKQIRAFSAPYPIVVPSGSCAGMLKYHYPEMFEGTREAGAAQSFADRVFELSEYLVDVLDVRLEDLGEPVRVTWHSSCHAMREMRIIEQSKSLIRQLRNVELIELEREHECCGFGGTFAVKQPAISAAMVKDKAADVAQTGASMVLSGDCGCLLNISGAMEHLGIPVTGKHLAEFIWERTNGKQE